MREDAAHSADQDRDRDRGSCELIKQHAIDNNNRLATNRPRPGLIPWAGSAVRNGLGSLRTRFPSVAQLAACIRQDKGHPPSRYARRDDPPEGLILRPGVFVSLRPLY
jgi:hypothetical protein